MVTSIVAAIASLLAKPITGNVFFVVWFGVGLICIACFSVRAHPKALLPHVEELFLLSGSRFTRLGSQLALVAPFKNQRQWFYRMLFRNEKVYAQIELFDPGANVPRQVSYGGNWVESFVDAKFDGGQVRELILAFDNSTSRYSTDFRIPDGGLRSDHPVVATRDILAAHQNLAIVTLKPIASTEDSSFPVTVKARVTLSGSFGTAKYNYTLNLDRAKPWVELGCDF